MTDRVARWREPADRARTRMGRYASVALVAVALAAPAPASAQPSAPVAPASSASAPTPRPSAVGAGKELYYVVPPPVDGQREYLFQIAVRTLGDGNRYREIFELNQGRPQPDGGALTDPTQVRPGWVLRLPPDARGPHVRTVAPTAPSPTGQVDVAAPNRSAASTGMTSRIAVAVVALVVMALLLALILRLAPARQRAAALVSRRAGPADGSARGRRRERAHVRADAPETPAAASAAQPAPAAPAPSAEALAETGHLSTPASEAAALGPMASSGPTTAQPERHVEVDGFVPQPRPADVMAELVALDGDPADRLGVRLLGVGEMDEAPYAWQESDGAPLAGTVPVAVGRRGPEVLWVDLARTPGVFTIVGTPDVARQHALRMAWRLRDAGLAVTVVGDVLGDDLPQGCERISAFPRTAAEAERMRGPGVVFCGGLRGAGLAVARALPEHNGHRVVPVLVGKVLRARWSVLVTPETAVPVATVGQPTVRRPSPGAGVVHVPQPKISGQ